MIFIAFFYRIVKKTLICDIRLSIDIEFSKEDGCFSFY